MEGNTLWQDAVKKEMIQTGKAFDIKPEGALQPVGYMMIKVHIVYDVKMSTLEHKARLVAAGFMSDPPSLVMYSSIVSCESVRIAFLLASLNNLEVLSADVSGAFLNAPCAE